MRPFLLIIFILLLPVSLNCAGQRHFFSPSNALMPAFGYAFNNSLGVPGFMANVEYYRSVDERVAISASTIYTGLRSDKNGLTTTGTAIGADGTFYLGIFMNRKLRINLGLSAMIHKYEWAFTSNDKTEQKLIKNNIVYMIPANSPLQIKEKLNPGYGVTLLFQHHLADHLIFSMKPQLKNDNFGNTMISVQAGIGLVF